MATEPENPVEPVEEAPGRTKTLREVMRPWAIRTLVGLPAAAGLYQFGCDQFAFPTLPKLWRMTGWAMPWWGWLLIAQAGFVYALFEYVRRTRVQTFDDATLRSEIADVMTFAEAMGVSLERAMNERLEKVGGKLDLTIELFGERLEKLEKGAADAKRAADASHQRIEAVEAKAQGARDYAEGTNHHLSDTLGKLEKEQRLFIQRMETWVGNLRREIRLGFKGVDQGFAAIYAREQLLDKSFDLTKLTDRLTQPSRGEPLGDWADWQNKAEDFHKAVEAWARLAEKYREGTIERVILDVPPREYKQDWGVKDYSIFPGHEAIHDYKTLCIISRNFHVERKSVDQYMLSKAFERPSMKPVLTIADLKDIEDEEPPASPPPPKVQS